MNLNVSGHHLEVTPAILGYVQSKLERIKRHFDQVIDAHVILSARKLRQKAVRICIASARKMTCTLQSTCWSTNSTARS